MLAPARLPPNPNRREFLRTSLAGSIVLLAAAGLPSGCARDEKAPRGLLVLKPGEYLTMAAVAARLIPRGGIFAAGAEDVGVARRVDRILARLEGDTQRQIGRALRIFEIAPLFSRNLRPFRRLSPGEQDRVLHAWHSSRRSIRTRVFDALKALTMLAFYDSHEGREAVARAPEACPGSRERSARGAETPPGGRP